jgi:hypothetical protein
MEENNQGTITEGGRLSTIDLHIMTAHFVKKANNIFNIKSDWSKLVSTKRSTVLSLPLQECFPVLSGENDIGRLLL